MGSNHPMMKETIRQLLSGEQYKDPKEDVNRRQQEDYEYPGIEIAEPIQRAQSKISSTVNAYLYRGLPADFFARQDMFKDLPNFSGYRAERTDFPKENVSRRQQEDYEYPGIEIAEPIQRAQSKTCSTVNAYLNRGLPADFLARQAEFKDLPNFSGYRVERTDFPDTELTEEPAIFLLEIPDNEVCVLGKHLFTVLSTGVSQHDLGILFLLAFQLKTPGIKSQKRVFPATIGEIFNTTRDITYTELDARPVTVMSTEVEPTISGNISEDAKAYAFLAASMLRMFARAPENYARAWTHINDGYKSFYKDSISVTGISINDEVLKTIRRFFAIDPPMKTTLFRILYHTNESVKHESIKNFLYKIHLSHTGMHILPIFVRLCAELKCSSGLLLSCFYGGEFDVQINALATLLRFTVSSDPKKMRKMWIYGRIFDQSFMSSLQTSNCPRFVYILAAALKMEKPKENVGILNIIQLLDISAVNKRRCELAAERLIFMVRTAINGG